MFPGLIGKRITAFKPYAQIIPINRAPANHRRVQGAGGFYIAHQSTAHNAIV